MDESIRRKDALVPDINRVDQLAKSVLDEMKQPTRFPLPVTYIEETESEDVV
jgi:hypothetical protein